MVFLQTSCSKDQATDQNPEAIRKSAPVPLTRNHAAVLNFKESYDDYVAGDSYSYNTLNIDDAEWILEAAFNYDHVIPDLSEIDDFGITYVDADDHVIPVGDYLSDFTVSSSDLFSIYSDLLGQVVSVSDMAPMSDFEINPINSSTARLTVRHASKAAPIDLYLQHTTPVAYDDYHRSWETSGNIKSDHWISNAPTCGTPNVSSIWSWEALMVNLRASKTKFITNGSGSSPYWTNLVFHDYGNDPFLPISDPNCTYKGPSSQDYTLDIYGANPTHVNGSSFADGHWAQCISKAQMQSLEASMADILDDHITNPDEGVMALTVKATEAHSTTSPAISNWTHHIFEFTTGTENP
ncbi:hypothetical protein [Owenweeksia hongkongensis]|uniref:hypothetical protein n=1 Tax=Owenweeksia hongkongensis TaxID=253245 RepID=UPI003A90083B